MNSLTPIQFLKEVESSYDLDSVKINNEPIWPFLRNYFATKVNNAQGREVNLTLKQKISMLPKLFYGTKYWFKKYDTIIFSNTLEKRKKGDKYYDKLFDEYAYLKNNSLIIETPVYNHFKRNKLENTNICSSIPLYFRELIYSKLHYRNTTIENENILKEICLKYKLEVNYFALAKRFLAQQRTMKRLIKKFKPKTFAFSFSYNKQGYIIEANNQNVNTIEFQHGIIDSNHIAYNLFKNYSKKQYPNYLLSYGKREKNFFASNGNFIDSSNVFPIGHSYLDYILNNAKPSVKFKNQTKSFSKLICVSLQEIEAGFELVKKISEISKNNPNIGFLLAPRKESEEFYNSNFNIQTNMLFIKEHNVYELMRFCDFHLTVYSTCALEALPLGAFNILYNIENKSKIHFEWLEKQNEHTRIINQNSELVKIINNTETKRESIIESGNQIFQSNYRQNLINFIQQND